MAINFYLKLDSIPGECTDSGYENTIKLHSWSWGSNNTASVGGTTGMSGGTVSMSDLNGMKDFDKSSPELLKAICTGKTIGSGTLTAVKSTGDSKPAPFLKIDLTDIFVTSQQLSASSELPTESISLAYAKVKVDYSTQDVATGSLTSTGAVTYDITKKLVS